jgi:D-glycero-alpha-D-manno-heptose-7-phosphate kinase
MERLTNSEPSSRWFPGGRAFFTSRTPFRLSFFGGGTDYPQWYRQEGGAVLSTSIDKYCYVSARWLPPFFSYNHRIVWSHIETVSSLGEIMHPAVRQGLRMFGFTDAEGIELHHQADLPARTGIGSSSAFAVGLIRVLAALRHQSLEREALYLKAIELEQTWIKDAVGSQDQVATAVGGLNMIRFAQDGHITVQPLDLPPERQAALESRLLLVYTGLSRVGPELARQIIDNLPHRTATLHRMRALVDQAAALLTSQDDLDGFGDMLDETWALKRALSDQISNDRIDTLYAAARAAGARGGKLLGAGSSGFIVLYVPPERQSAVREALSTLLEVPFRFDNQGSVLMNGRWA